MSIRIINADVFDGLRQLEAGSVHCVVTSPPYFGLRDYGTSKWSGGDPACDHVERTAEASQRASTLGPKADGLNPANAAFRALERQFRGLCGKCGAERMDKQIGLERTPDEYVMALIKVFHEVRRVLRDDGTCWLNLGDSYWAKELIGIPWRVAFGMQAADDWYLRQDIIWAKPNPMPESVTDRCTKAHEYVFLFSKSPKYYFDAEAISEDCTKVGSPGHLTPGAGSYQNVPHTPRPSAKRGEFNGKYSEPAFRAVRERRNKRSVWEISSQPFPEAHFATFPPELPEICIKAGSPEGGLVLDPFGGAGTTGLVADRLRRDAVLIELNPEYAAMAAARIQGDCPMFSDVREGNNAEEQTEISVTP